MNRELSATTNFERLNKSQQTRQILRLIFIGVSVGIVLFLTIYHLPQFPLTWFDEGSHLHVPKTLVLKGVYADYSSEGFRYYGPTIGVGPTVMLPIAAAFKLFGIGLFQARLVMVLYLLAAIYSFFHLAKLLGDSRLAWVATALLVTTRGVSLLENGRQVLGEVPGFFFLLVAFGLWFAAWERANWRRLIVVGLLLGLSVITKYQYLLVVVPTLGLGWLANLLYYRSASQRTFIIPGIVAGISFVLWQIYLVLYLGPATAMENLTSLRIATSGAALVFSTDLMKRGIQELLSLKVYLGWLVPVLIYGVSLVVPRNKDGQKWGLLYILIAVNLVWYVVASVSWVRYAFTGLAFSSLFVARFFYDLTDGYHFSFTQFWEDLRHGLTIPVKQAISGALLAWLAVMIVVPLGQTALEIIFPPFNAPAAMASYLDENIPQNALIDTWEPEMGFLTNHNYHFPPQLLLNTAVGYIWTGGPPPSQFYDFMKPAPPEYVLVGEFSRWVNLYSPEILSKDYTLVKQIGSYDLYKLKSN